MKIMGLNISDAKWHDQYFGWVYSSFSQYNFKALTRPYVKWHDVLIMRIS